MAEPWFEIIAETSELAPGDMKLVPLGLSSSGSGRSVVGQRRRKLLRHLRYLYTPGRAHYQIANSTGSKSSPTG
jgi:hypothetical protein